MVRNFFAGILLIAAVTSALGGAALQWAQHMAGTPEPAQQLATAVARNKAVIDALTGTIQKSITQKIPALADQVPGARQQLNQLITQSIDAALAHEDIESAWQKTINTTRQSLISDLQAYGRGSGEAPSVWVDLTAFVDLAWSNVQSSASPTVQRVLAETSPPGTSPIKAAQLTSSQAKLASDSLALAGYWWAAYGLAAFLLICGLALGTRMGRWVLLALSALTGAATIVALRALAGSIIYPASTTLDAAVGTTVVSQLTASLSSWLEPLWLGFLGLAVFGLFGAIIAWSTGRKLQNPRTAAQDS